MAISSKKAAGKTRTETQRCYVVECLAQKTPEFIMNQLGIDRMTNEVMHSQSLVEFDYDTLEIISRPSSK